MKAVLALIFAFLLGNTEARTLAEALEANNKAFIADVAKTKANAVAPAIMASYARVSRVSGVDVPFYVSVLDHGGATLPEGMVVDISLELMSEIQRCFILAHEFAHLKRKHYDQRMGMLSKYVTGDVDDEAVKPTYAWVLLRPEMREQSWRLELEADEDAAKVLLQLGYSEQDILLAVQGFRILPSTPTHPSTTQRFMNLRRILGR